MSNALMCADNSEKNINNDVTVPLEKLTQPAILLLLVTNKTHGYYSNILMTRFPLLGTLFNSVILMTKNGRTGKTLRFFFGPDYLFLCTCIAKTDNRLSASIRRSIPAGTIIKTPVFISTLSSPAHSKPHPSTV